MKEREVDKEKGSVTVEATFVMIIVIIIIFSLMYLLFYCCDLVKAKSCFWYDTISYTEEYSRKSILEDAIEEEDKEGLSSYLKENFKQGILSYGIENCEIEEGVWNDTYTMQIKIADVFPILKSLVNKKSTEIQVKCVIHNGAPCEIARMYQALIAKE